MPLACRGCVLRCQKCDFSGSYNSHKRWQLCCSYLNQKDRSGQGRQLIYGLLSKSSMKKVIVVDEDIDVFNPVEVEWLSNLEHVVMIIS